MKPKPKLAWAVWNPRDGIDVGAIYASKETAERVAKWLSEKVVRVRIEVVK